MGNGANVMRAIVGLKPKIAVDEQLRNACFFGQLDIVQEIISEIPRGPGGAVDAPDAIGYTPIIYAAGSGYPEILEALLQHGASLNWKAQNGFTAMHKAAESGKIKCLNVLLQWRAEINIQSTAGYTPAMLASMEKKDLFLKVLIDNKADLTIKDNKGNTCLDLAKHAGTMELLEEGLQHRSDAEAKRRQQLAEKKAMLEAKLKEARLREEQTKAKRRVEEEEAQRFATEKHMKEMTEKARKDNEEFERQVRETQQRERELLEAKTRREAEIVREREMRCQETRLSLPTLAAFLTLDNHYVLCRLLDSSKIANGKAMSTENQEFYVNMIQELTARKKVLTDQLLLLNITPIVPNEYLNVGRWGGVLGQVDWVIANVTAEWNATQEHQSLADRIPVEETQTMKELQNIKVFFRDNDSAEGRMKQQRELDAHKVARDAAIQAENDREDAEKAAAEAERVYQEKRKEEEIKARTIAHLRSVLCKELGLPLPLTAAYLTLCNAAILARIIGLNKAVTEAEGNVGDDVLEEIKALAANKAKVSQQLLDLELGGTVPVELIELQRATSGGVSTTSGEHERALSLVTQLDWLSIRVREMQIGGGGGGGEGEESEGGEDEEEKEQALSLEGTIQEASKQLVHYITKLQVDLGKIPEQVASLSTPGTPAWRRDRVLTTLAVLRNKVLGGGREQELAKAQNLLAKLEDMKNALAAAASTKGKALSAQQQEEQEKTAYFAAKAQRIVQEQEEARRLEEARLLEEIRRKKQEREEARLESFEVIASRKPEAVRVRGGPVDQSADLESMRKFRDKTLGILPG